MQWFRRDKGDNNDDFIQMKRANENGNGEVVPRVRAFAPMEKGRRWFKVQKERNSMLLLTLRK